MEPATPAHGSGFGGGLVAADYTEDVEHARDNTGRRKMQLLQTALIVVSFSILQVISYTAFRMADFRGFNLDSIIPLLKDWRFWIGVLCSGGILILSFTLVRISESSLVLVLLLYLNSVLVGFLLLPLTWRFVFDERIFTTPERTMAFVLAMVSALGLLGATYLWNKGG